MDNSETKHVNILTISGSLRENSSNNAVINTAATMVAENVSLNIYKGLGSLPHFDDSKEPGPEVTEFRNLVQNADGVLICSPEYAFGVPGVLKNALDWTVSSGDFVNKPVALITAATGGDKAHASLLLTLGAISAIVTDETKLLISFIRSKLGENGMVKDPATLQAVGKVMAGLIELMAKQDENLPEN